MADRAQRSRNSDTIRMCAGMVGAQKMGVGSWPKKGGDVPAREAALQMVEAVEATLRWVAGDDVDIEKVLAGILTKFQEPLIPTK